MVGSGRGSAEGGGEAGLPLVVLVAPDSFKGSLTSVEVAQALAAGWGRARPADRLLLAPLADGGEGTLVAIAAAGGWAWRTASVADPLGRTLEARWLVEAGDAGPGERARGRDEGARGRDEGARGRGEETSAGGGRADLPEPAVRAVVELAEASGLSRLAPAERNPRRASTVGTGQLLQAALDAGARRITLGIGGSATTDGGAGLLVALGARLRGPAGELLAPDGDPGEAGWPGVMAALETIELDGLDPRLAELELAVACDVGNPLLGPRGAAATYGPQKGATPTDVADLDAALARWADRLEAATGRRERDTSGAGAAGGVGFALLCLAGRLGRLEFQPGVELVMAETGFAAKLAEADLVLTGEGRIDAQTAFGKTAMGVARRATAAGRPIVAQTAFGKTAMGVARRATAAGRPIVAVGGGATVEGISDLGRLGVVVVPVVEAPQSVEAAMAAGAAPIERCGERIARLVSIGIGFGSRGAGPGKGARSP